MSLRHLHNSFKRKKKKCLGLKPAYFCVKVVRQPLPLASAAERKEHVQQNETPEACLSRHMAPPCVRLKLDTPAAPSFCCKPITGCAQEGFYHAATGSLA